MKVNRILLALTLSLAMPAVIAIPVLGHHTLGINQTGKATRSPQIPEDREIQIEDYQINVTVMPGHPQPFETTRVIVYTKNLASGAPYLGIMRFSFAEQSLFGTGEPFLETEQTPIEDRHIQTIEFPSAGTHVVRLGLLDKERLLEAEFSLEVGESSSRWKYFAVIVFAMGVGWVVWEALGNRRRKRLV